MGGTSGEALQRAKIQAKKFRAVRERKRLREATEQVEKVATPEEILAKQEELRRMYRDKFHPGAELPPLSAPAPPPPSNTRLYFCRYCKKYQHFTQIQPNVWKCPSCPFTTHRR